MKTTKRFGTIPGVTGLRTDGRYLSVRGSALVSRGRALLAYIDHAAIAPRSVGQTPGRFIDLYGAQGEILGSTRVYGLSGKVQRASAYVNQLVAAAHASTLEPTPVA